MVTTADGARMDPPPRSLQLPGIILGVGLGGFVDGILLHQLLQWHHMLTSTNHDRIGVKYYPATTIEGLKMNTVWDGIFHAICWLAVLVGLAILYSRVTHHRSRAWASPALWGWILVGWGVFNIVEGLLDHQLLGIHHVHAGAQQAWWDLGFLLLGALFVVAGQLIQRRGRPLGAESETGSAQTGRAGSSVTSEETPAFRPGRNRTPAEQGRERRFASRANRRPPRRITGSQTDGLSCELWPRA